MNTTITAKQLLAFAGGEFELQSSSCHFRGGIREITLLPGTNANGKITVTIDWLATKEMDGRLLPAPSPATRNIEFTPREIVVLSPTEIQIQDEEGEEITLFSPASSKLEKFKLAD